jgi:hypothetical protein
MSTNLYWYPAPPEPHGQSLSRGLKFRIARKYWGHDGSLGGDPRVLTAEDVPYLEGVRDGSDKETAQDAQVLIDGHRAIREHRD